MIFDNINQTIGFQTMQHSSSGHRDYRDQKCKDEQNLASHEKAQLEKSTCQPSGDTFLEERRRFKAPLHADTAPHGFRVYSLGFRVEVWGLGLGV